MKLGITGGVACGKSTMLDFFAEAGFSCIASDALVTQLYEQDTELLSKVHEYFGDAVFDSCGKINRKELAKLVFNHTESLAKLEQLLHPRVGQLWQTALQKEPNKNWAVEIPLLFEKKLEKHFDYTLCISTHLTQQLTRLRKKNWSEVDARLRIAKQMPLEQKTHLADFVICNDGSQSFFKSQFKCLMDQKLKYLT